MSRKFDILGENECNQEPGVGIAGNDEVERICF
jgi:hypothetical protein